MKNLAQSAASHFRDVFFGGNWTDVDVKNTISDISWQEATHKLENFNTIAALVFHIGYFVDAALQVFEENKLEARDKFSFDVPPISSDQEWRNLCDRVLNHAERLAGHIEQMDNSKFAEFFMLEKYGSYFRNIIGTIEHTHYHLGQIVILKKLLRQTAISR